MSLAKANIEGEISINEVGSALATYYEKRDNRDCFNRTQEADLVSMRISQLLGEKAFSFTINEYLSIHRKLFSGIYNHAGKIRDFNISKKEWFLKSESVTYGTASELIPTLNMILMKRKTLIIQV